MIIESKTCPKFVSHPFRPIEYTVYCNAYVVAACMVALQLVTQLGEQ
jgi:hypothetical protein